MEVPVAPPTDIIWLVACHGPGGGAGSERTWCSYAHFSRPGAVVRMNASLYNNARPAAGEGTPNARLSTLDDAVTRARQIPHVPQNVKLVLFMHGVADITTSYGIIHSTGATPMVDLQDMGTNAQWDNRVLPIGWRTRTQNVHYQAFVRAISGWAAVTQVHLYGCQLGNTLFKRGMAELAQDMNKEVWGYTGYTVTSRQQVKISTVHDTAGDPAIGARAQGAGFARVTLQAGGGPLPGWQVRGRMQGGSPRIDVCTVNDLGQQVVEVHTIQTIQSALGGPERTVGI
ncbi:MAG: hypothetical protein AB1714_26870 [Acidobacteriota bacterium]